MFRKTASIAVSALVTAGLVAGSIVGVASAASAVETPKATIDGVLSLGATLTAKATDFVELPATFTYEWVNYTENPTAVIGRLSTYTPNSGDRGDDLIVTIKSPTETATSPTALVGGGTLSTGQSSVVPGASYSVSGTFFAPSVDYVIDAGTNKIPVKSDASGNFTVSIPVATTEKAGTKSVSAVHATAGKISSTTIIVTQPPKPPVIKGSSPTISGTVQVNKTIRASVGSWSKGVTFDYQWLLDSKAIPGEINSTYSIRPTDVGHSIRLRLLGQADDAALGHLVRVQGGGGEVHRHSVGGDQGQAEGGPQAEGCGIRNLQSWGGRLQLPVVFERYGDLGCDVEAAEGEEVVEGQGAECAPDR